MFCVFLLVVFTCSDNSSITAFGAGNLGENKTGDCNGDMIGYQTAQCDASGYWIVTHDNCVTRLIQCLKDRSQVKSYYSYFGMI